MDGTANLSGRELPALLCSRGKRIQITALHIQNTQKIIILHPEDVDRNGVSMYDSWEHLPELSQNVRHRVYRDDNCLAHSKRR